MTGLLVVLLLLLTVGYSVVNRSEMGSPHKNPNLEGSLEPLKRKPDLSRVPTLPPIRPKHSTRDGTHNGNHNGIQDLRNRRAS